MSTRKQQLLQFLAQNDNDMLDEEADDVLWVSILSDESPTGDLVVELGDTNNTVVARYRLTLTELP